MMGRCGAGGGLVQTQPQNICTFGLRERMRRLTYTRCAATSGTCRIRERRKPTAAASHFTPSGRTCRQAATEKCQVETAGGGRTTQGDSLFPLCLWQARRDADSLRLRAAWCASAGADTLVDRLRAAQLKMRAGRRCHPLKRRYGQGILMSPAAVASQPGDSSRSLPVDHDSQFTGPTSNS